MDKCQVCGGTSFHIVAGFYYCDECQAQLEAKKEQDVEFSTDPRTRMKKTMFMRPGDGVLNKGDEMILTSWEKFNFILIGMTNELIQLGASEKIKLTVAQLWATYLGKLEVAFTSTRRQAIPKLSRRYDRRDAQIIYGKFFDKSKKKKRRAGSVTSASGASQASSGRDIAKRKKMLIDADYKSQVSNSSNPESSLIPTSDSESSEKSTGSARGPRLQFNHLAQKENKKVAMLSAKQPKLLKKKFRAKYLSPSYLYGPDMITPKKLWALLYLALRLNQEDIHLSDMFRFARDGHLSYYKLDHFIPTEYTLDSKEMFQLTKIRELSYHGLVLSLGRLKKFLRVWKFPQPNVLTLIKQYCTELQLPTGIVQYAERILAAWPPGFNFNHKETHAYPNYEGRAMAYIIVTMKILFGLDGVTENEISRVVERINEVAEERQLLNSRLFSFREWQRYIECRRAVLITEHLPTKLRYDPHSLGNCHLFPNFFQSMHAKSTRNNDGNLISNHIPGVLTDDIYDTIKDMSRNLPEPKQSKVFTPSLTPQHSYLQQLLEDTKDPDRNLPGILRQDFTGTKVGYMRNPESLKELAAQCDIELNIVYSSASYVRKVMQVWDPQMAQCIMGKKVVKTHNRLTRVVAPTNTFIYKKSDDPCEYLHRKRPGKILLETKKLRLYNKMMNLYQEQKKMSDKNLNQQQNQTVQSPTAEENNRIIAGSSREENNHSTQNKSTGENSEMLQDEPYEKANEDHDYFGFGQVLPNGKLNISEFDSDSDSEDHKKENKAENILLSNFEKQSMVNPVPNPWDVKKTFRNLGFGYDPQHLFPLNRKGRRYPVKKNRKKKAADEDAIQEAPENSESGVQVEPESTTSDVIVIVVGEDKINENEASADNPEVVSQNNENEVIAEDIFTNEDILIDEDTIVVFDDSPAEPLVENKEANEPAIVIIDDNKENESTNEPTIEVIDVNKENETAGENKTIIEVIEENKDDKIPSDFEMEIDFEAFEDKIDIETKNIESIQTNEPGPAELIDDVDEITLDDQSGEEPEDSEPNREIIINDESTDDEVSILAENIDSRPSVSQKDSPEKELLTLFVPYKQYWLYRSVALDNLNSKQFRTLQREFSINFRWLLHQCAGIIENLPEKLYKEVCIIESFYTDILAPDEHMEKCEDYNTQFFRSKVNKTTVRKRWNDTFERRKL